MPGAKSGAGAPKGPGRASPCAPGPVLGAFRGAASPPDGPSGAGAAWPGPHCPNRGPESDVGGDCARAVPLAASATAVATAPITSACWMTRRENARCGTISTSLAQAPRPGGLAAPALMPIVGPGGQPPSEDPPPTCPHRAPNSRGGYPPGTPP